MSKVEEAQYWRDKVVGAARGQLETVQKTATSWSALLSSLLGVFGVVAFAGGLKSIDDLDTLPMYIAKGLTVLGAVSLMAATYKAAQASGRIAVEYSSDTSWSNYRDRTIDQARAGAANLKAAKQWGAAAAIAVIGGSMFVLFVGKPASLGPTVIVDAGDSVVCGRMSWKDGQIAVGGQVVDSVASLTVVSACPDEP